jgi:hypothetical protein
MTRYTALFVLLAAGCNGSKDGDSGTATGETGDTMTMETGTTMTDCVGGAYEGPITITEVEVTCAGTAATISANTDGVTGGGWSYATDSANNPPFEENHPLTSTGADPTCNTDVVGVSLTVGPDYTPGSGTIFTCDDHYNDAAVMTYAVAVSDDTGALVDCWAWGVNATEFIAGTLGAPDFDATQCTEYTPMR